MAAPRSQQVFVDSPPVLVDAALDSLIPVSMLSETADEYLFALHHIYLVLV